MSTVGVVTSAACPVCLRAHKTMMKQKKDLEKQLHLGMKHKGDVPVVPEDHNLFSLRSIRSASVRLPLYLKYSLFCYRSA